VEKSTERRLLIIYPHWPPSNLAGVHRARLIANFARHFNWKVTVLTVFPRYYEELPDWDLNKTVSHFVDVVQVSAIPVLPLRLIGDIGLRSLHTLFFMALRMLRTGDYHFVWIPIPSFYTALLGPLLHLFTRVPYGIDYIDPWVRDISNRKNIRAIISQWLARMLEPIALSRVSLISGVSQKYFEPAIKRNFRKNSVATVAMPYGFDMADHTIKLEDLNMPWKPGEQVILYAGAFLPNSGLFLKHVFEAVASLHAEGKWPAHRKFYFLGTGAYQHKSVLEYAIEANISHLVVEIRSRYPFLHILNFLSQAWRLLVLGSTEEHYTASKIFQVVLSLRPFMSVFHEHSSALTILQECHADVFCVKYSPEEYSPNAFGKEIQRVLEMTLGEVAWKPDLKAIEKYSAEASAGALFKAIESII